MQTTLKRIDVGSAFKVGLVLFGLMSAVFGLLFVGLQGVFLTGITSMLRDAGSSASGYSFMMTGGLVGLCFLYGMVVIFGAIGGGIQFAVTAFFYNLTVNWIGGIKIELEAPSDDLLDDIERDLGKPKRGET